MKISVLSLLLIAAVFGLTLLTGCDEGMQMMKPAMEKPVPPEMEPPMGPEGSIGLTKEEAREKARGVVMDTVYARQILMNPLLDLPSDAFSEGFPAVNDEGTRILLDKTGFTWPQVGKLVAIHLEENAHEAALAEASIADSGAYFGTWVDVVAKYLEITFRHPAKMEDEILELFREYARDGETTASVENVKADYFSVANAGPPDGIRLTDDGQLLISDWTIIYIYQGYDPTQEVPDKFLPLILSSYPELEPGKYRVKPKGILDERADYVKQGRYISGVFVEGSLEEGKHIRVIIEFTSDTPELKLNWGADSDEAIRPGDEIVVEILRKRDVLTYGVGFFGGSVTDHIYEARPIRNLSRPEIVFEFVEFEEEEAAEAMAADAAAE